ncbi:hypothetical protein UAW_03115 [Enterococcus haemoperoxidus ATCC BAA-382]|uniref:DUF5067 domain-containing protein n=1 Tax=Enterococcus haemoperoxidus ATCC BAA-382 TaxID=1158608 RepID=R2SAD9_9ENTE|nr:DUF5067 domain-containing protein [Enterococcus haemoperoxidus]EOH92450.1 hypothetical protein UAW_03115 [Enterococcus haemoperoxidus ATCC BAA-382]EOT61816.1 hypothetical protein I583_00798 [Enterococcus haemoperoxidus ATCC BAA-382]OJG53912.1 hypothetical protein RV06_GL000531 [Enterococcus haemoperoxidus]
MDKKYIGWVIILLIFISGCSAKLSEKKESFSGKGITYSVQLPSTWEKSLDYKVTYSNEALFGAKDTKSNSTLMIMAERKDLIDRTDFGERIRKELQKQYNYKKASDIFMKEFNVGKYKGYKYTLDTTFNKRDSWLHLYYIETAHGMVQLNYYSAKDGNYEKRAKIIDESARSVKEIEDKGAKTDEEEGNIVFENDTLNLALTGVMNVTGEADQKVLALRYTVTNKAKDQSIKANKWDETIQVTQNGVILAQGNLAKNNSILDIPKLMAQKEEELPAGGSLEGVTLYELKEEGDVLLVPNKTIFKDAKDIPIVVLNGTEKAGEK